MEAKHQKGEGEEERHNEGEGKRRGEGGELWWTDYQVGFLSLRWACIPQLHPMYSMYGTAKY